MTDRWDTIVVGAGIGGLAAAYELRRRGLRVLVLETEGVGAGQSAGLARIFRVAHRDPGLCALALEARAGWRRWEHELGAGRLLGDEGLVVAGEERAAAHGEAMRAAGAEAVPLTRREIAQRIPFLRSPWETGLWDGLAGSLRIRRALTALARRVTVRHATVRAVNDGHVHLDGGQALAADVVLVCAGLATPALVAPAGIDAGMRAFHHVRLSYRMRQPAPAACLIAAESYGVPLGSTGRWALGLHDAAPPPLESESPDAAAAATRRRHAAWVPQTFPGLDPEPVDEIRCVSLEAPWLDAGDGFVIRRAGRVIALAGGNLMKFGPVLGERLARAALDPVESLR
jgi:glycine/D-amino acid oxidase-like deaminating enzyme